MMRNILWQGAVLIVFMIIMTWLVFYPPVG